MPLGALSFALAIYLPPATFIWHCDAAVLPVDVFALYPDGHVGHVFPDLYDEPLHVATVHRLDIVLFVFHDDDAHVFRFVIAVHDVQDDADVAPAELVLPAPHAVHPDAPAALYEPATHCVWDALVGPGA